MHTGLLNKNLVTLLDARGISAQACHIKGNVHNQENKILHEKTKPYNLNRQSTMKHKKS